MAKNKPKYPFYRRLDLIKDIVYETNGGEPKKIASFIDELAKMKPIKDFFSQTENSINIGSNPYLSSMDLEELQSNPFAIGGENRYYTYLFPSDLVRALTHLINIFAERGVSGLSEFDKGELVKVKTWGKFETSNRALGVDEVAFIEHYDDIQKMLNAVVNAYGANRNILDKTEKPIEKTISDEDLEKLLDSLEKEPETGGGEAIDLEDENQKNTQAKPRSAVVPPVAPSPSPATTTTPSSAPAGNYPKPLTAHEEQKLVVREISKLHAQALGRMFGAYGIDSSQIDLALSANLRSEISKQFYSLTPKERAKFITLSSLGRATDVGKSTLREGFLTKVYSEFGSNSQNIPHLNALYESINNNPKEFDGLDKNKLAEFKEFHYSFVSEKINKVILPNPSFKGVTKQSSPEEQLEASLAAILPNDKKDITNTNIEKAIETLILQNEDKNGVSTRIDGMNALYLAALLGIPSIKTMSPTELENFKSALTAYSAKKTIEIAISTGNTRLLGNPRTVVEGNKPITKHLSFVSVGDSTREHGAETTENALNYKRKDRKEEVKKIAKQYKSFFGLWENLSAKEQRIVYSKFNIAYDKNMDKNRKLVFVPEFLFFDVGSLKSFKNIKPENYNEFLEINQSYLKDIGEQLVKEEQLGQFLRDYYLFSTHEHQTLLIADYLANQNPEITLTEFPDAAFFDQFSANEIANADQHIQDTNYALSSNGQQFSRRSSLGHKVRNSKLGKILGLGNTNTPSSKMSRALKSKIAKKLTSVINALPPGFISTFLKIARKIGFKRVAKIIVGTLGALLGGLAYLLGRFPGWLKSTLGMGGSEVGGITAANTVSNTAITGSELTGAEMGNSLGAAQKLTNTSANTAITQATASNIAQSSGVFFGIPIAFLAPGTAMFIGLVVTIYTIFTIQSAFLVATPPGLDGYSSGGDPILGELACFQLMPGGETLSNGVVTANWDDSSVELLKSSFEKVASNTMYIKLLCDAGPVMIYRSEEDFGGGEVISANEIILYQINFNSVRIMEYTLIHETGHIIDNRNGGKRTDYISIKKESNNCYTYPIFERCDKDGDPFMESEAFAEGIAIYVLGNDFSGRNSKFPTNFPFENKYPKEYKWFGTNIFGGEKFP